MPSPPADLTPAMATILMDDKSSDRTVSAGLVDLAARGSIAFVADWKPTGGTETGIKYLGEGEAGLSAPEASLRDDIAKKSVDHDNYLTPHTLYRLISGFDDLKSDLEAVAVKRGWLTAKPSEVTFRWYAIGSLEMTAAIVIGFFWILTQVSSLFVAAVSLALAGVVTLVVARYMPSRTPQGAMLWSMLSAYRRTLALTLANAHTMTDAVKARALPWVTTPDQIMAWGVALGLNDEIQAVLGRSMGIDEEEPAASIATRWYPRWWLSEPSHGHAGHAVSGPAASSASGLFSASAIPDPGSIMAALGSISHPWEPSSSSSGSSHSSFSSGSFGGGGGGGGGGAGGGF